MASTLRAGQRKVRNDDDRGKGAISAREGRDIEEMSAPRTPVIYRVVSKFGEEEMDRPAVSLWWSGVAAGLSISFSLLAQTISCTLLVGNTPFGKAPSKGPRPNKLR